MNTRLLFVVNEDSYFVSHRLALAIAAVKAGYEVILATRIRLHGQEIESAGIRVIPLNLSRRSGNPFLEIWTLLRLYQQVRPDLIHHVGLKTVIYGACAAKLVKRCVQINAIAGLGWIFTTSNIRLIFIRPVLRRVMSFLLNEPNSTTIVQNQDDFGFLRSAGVSAQRIRLIPGAGVDVNLYRPVDKKESLPCIVLASRMLWDKGVGEFVEAAKIITRMGLKARFVLVGAPDPANPASISEDILLDWHKNSMVEWWGQRDDMPEVWQQAHIACLPSYREGMPKALLEAAASGLPIVTTNVPGCREVVVEGEEGLVVPHKDSEALARALIQLIRDAKLRIAMGAKARVRAKARFCSSRVIDATLAIYSEAFKCLR